MHNNFQYQIIPSYVAYLQMCCTEQYAEEHNVVAH